MAQAPSGDPWAAPSGLSVSFVDVGQGDATIVVGPNKRALVYDAGPPGTAIQRVLPELRRLGVSRVDHLVISHYDIDHLGGAAELMRGISVVNVWDRGTRDAPNHSSYRSYVSAAGSRRRRVSLGQTLDLGAGLRLRVLAYDGKVFGRSPLPIRNTNQRENAGSVVLRLDYGQFSMWLGGDLTGGGNNTYDCETSIARVCGDVDFYKANHHGSWTSSNANLVASIRPDVVLAANGAGNRFRHPSTTTLNRLNTRSASRLYLNTSDGYGYDGYTVSGTTRVVSDGFRYRITSQGGSFSEVYVDEYAGATPQPGELVISELMRDASTSKGKYLELRNVSGRPLSLKGLRVDGNLGSVTIATPYRLLPGGFFTLAVNGMPSRNGGIPWCHALPFRALDFGRSFDRLRVSVSGRTIDALSYSSSGSGQLPGGRAISAERVLAIGASAPSNFAAASARYGASQGSPGSENSRDRTQWPLLAGAELLSARDAGGRALHLFAGGFDAGGKLDLAALSFGSAGIRVGSTTIPLSPDLLFSLSLQFPGFASVMPSSGRKGLRVPIPVGVTPRVSYFAHFLFDPRAATIVPVTSKAARFVLP